MPIEVIAGVVENSYFEYVRGGGEMLRQFYVGGLTPGPDVLYRACFAQDSITGVRIPQYNEQLEGVPNLYCYRVRAEPPRESRHQALVRAYFKTYPWPNQTTVRIISASGTKILSRNPDGTPLANIYVDTSDPKHPTTGINYVECPILSPNMVLEVTRWEGITPMRSNYQYRRRVNSVPWQGGEKGTWLMRSVDSESLGVNTDDLGGGGWLTTYRAEWDPDGWDVFNYYRDDVTGWTPTDLGISTDGTQQKGVLKVSYQTADFNNIGLPSIF
jgi:hypothetical protein